MSRTVCLFFVLFVITTFSGATSAAGKRPVDIWNYYHFNGTAFVSGPASDGGASIAVREKSQPVVLKSPGEQAVETTLPDGAGVIAGICYLQNSGGKLGGGSTFQPCPRATLVISTDGKQLVSVQTDEHGYFVVVLPTGKYSIGSGPFAAEITVERGITTLAPLRAGKRMVD